MIKTKSVKAVIMAVTILSLVTTIYGETILALKGNKYVSTNEVVRMDNIQYIKPVSEVYAKEIELPNTNLNIDIKPIEVAEAKSEEEIQKELLEAKMNEVVYDGLTLRELSEKLDRSLHSTLSGQGYAFASKAVELGIDPYLAVAIVMHETGCKWECSSLLKKCNNVGGMKSGTNCSGTSYAAFPTLEEGINAYMENLYKNYISKGLTTASTVGPKYARSDTWVSKVNAYINQIKAA